jgi:uncharacterized protein YuzE
MEAAVIKDIKKILPWFIRHKNIWSDYDSEADTLYLHFKKPNHADHSEMTEDDVILRYEKGELIGMTILNASKRLPMK